MLLYRLGHINFIKDLRGEGARLYGGRWNHKGTPALYTSTNLSLASLEVAVHIGLDNLPDKFMMVTYELPDDYPYFHLMELPKNWDSLPFTSSSQDIGTQLLQESNYLALKVPSAVTPGDFNIIINPRHQDIDSLKIKSIKPFSFDDRLKR